MSTVTPNSAKVLKYEVPAPLNLKLARPRPILLDFTEARATRKGSPGKAGEQGPQANRRSLLFQARPRSRNEQIELFSPKSTSSAKFELHLAKASGETKKKVNFSRTQLIMPSADPVCHLVKSPRDDRNYQNTDPNLQPSPAKEEKQINLPDYLPANLMTRKANTFR